MLPKAHRLTRSERFGETVRRGRRAGGRFLVTHWEVGPETLEVGFVVSRAIGGAVTRNRVKRQLRELCRERLGGRLPATGCLVVRALPTAAEADSTALGADLDGCLGRVVA